MQPAVEGFEEAGIRVAERRFRAGDTIFRPGDPDGQLYFLLEGVVRLYKIHGEYNEATVALKDGGVFGELSLEEGPWQSVFAEALTDVRVVGVRKSILTEVVKRRPEFATKLFFSFSKRLKQSDEVIVSLLDRGFRHAWPRCSRTSATVSGRPTARERSSTCARPTRILRT